MWRVVLSPRWLLWHLLALLAVAGCVIAAIWQWDRAGSAMGSALNVGYGIQWPIFAVFFAYMWWRFLHNDVVEYRELRDLGALDSDAPVEPVAQAPAPAPWDREANPFTRTPMRADAITEDESPALVEYNRQLAELARKGRPSGTQVPSEP